MAAVVAGGAVAALLATVLLTRGDHHEPAVGADAEVPGQAIGEIVAAAAILKAPAAAPENYCVGVDPDGSGHPAGHPALSLGGKTTLRGGDANPAGV